MVSPKLGKDSVETGMNMNHQPESGYFSAHRVVLLLLLYVIIVLAVWGLWRTAKGVFLDEVRIRARDLAAISARLIDQSMVRAIAAAGNKGSQIPEFDSLVNFLQDTKATNPEIAFVYVIQPELTTNLNKWVFVADAQPFDVDLNEDGVVSPHEEGVVPGTAYDTADIPAIKRALREPVACRDYYTDPWGSFLSGFAPIRDPLTDETIAVLGVDLTRAAIQRKYLVVNLVTLAASTVLLLLFSFTIKSLYEKAIALETSRQLEKQVETQNTQLIEKNAVLADLNADLRYHEMENREELKLAQEVQQRFLPNDYPFPESLNFGAVYYPCSKIGGDLYNVFQISEQSVGFYIADVAGHGVSSALVSAVLRFTIERFRGCLCCKDPCQVVSDFMNSVNRQLRDTVPSRYFVTFLMGIINVAERKMILVNAGHHPPVVWRAASRRPELVDLEPNLPIGVFDTWRFQTKLLDIEQSDKVMFYTDGVVECRNEAEEEFGIRRLMRLVRKLGDFPPDRLVNEISHDIRVFSGPESPHDDQAILMVEFR